MRFLIPICGVACLMAGCVTEDSGFGSGGGRTDGPVNDDTGDTAPVEEDTATGGCGEGWEAPADEGGPSIAEPSVEREDFPNIGWHVVAEIPYCDLDQDISGGDLVLTISGEGFSEGGSQVSGKISSYSDTACEACLYDDYIYIAIYVGDDDPDYEIELYVEDKSGDRSNTVTFTAAGI